MKLTPHCEYHKYSFPRSHARWLDAYVVRFGPTSRGFDGWKQTYLGTLRKAAFLMQRERPLLKSPATMANLDVVLSLFPNAKFVHVKRDPHRVIPSQIHLHRTMARKYGLETITDEALVEFAFRQYRSYTDGFLRNRQCIPEGNLVEMRYESFVADRMGWLRTIYDTLGLGAFDSMAPRFERHIAAVKDYVPNHFDDDPELRHRIDDELAFAMTALGYGDCPAAASPERRAASA